jgi:hypothetical protein
MGKRKRNDRDLQVNELDVDDNKSLLAKRVASAVDEKKPTAPRAGKSAPAEPTLRKKARTGIERFADVAAREEETTQKALELKRTKFRGETEKAVARVRAQAEIQMNKDKLRMEYAQKKLEYKFKLQLQAAQETQRPQMRGQCYYPQTSYSFQQPQPDPEFSSFSGRHQDHDISQAGFSFSDYNSYSSQASADSRWQPNMASSSTRSQGSLSSVTGSFKFPLQVESPRQSASPYSGWEQTPGPMDDKKSESLSFTEQLNDDSEDLYM